MKMESPLEVLSRAVSIVQSESKTNKPALPVANSDSGIEDDMNMEYSERSPKCAASLPIKGSPNRNYDSDECHQRSPGRLLNAVKYLQTSSPKNPEIKCEMSTKSIKGSPERDYESNQYSQHSPERLLSAVKYLQKSSYKDLEPKQELSPKLIKSSPKRDYEFNEYSQSSPEQLFSRKAPPKYPEIKPQLPPRPIKSSPKRDYDLEEFSQRSPERLFNAVRYLQKSPRYAEHKPQLSPNVESNNYPHHSPIKHESNECKRKSPMRIIETAERHSKKIKLEEPDNRVSTYQSGELIANRCSRSVSPTRNAGEPRLIAKQNVPMLGTANSRHVQVLPRYLHSYPPYPPLFILTDKPTNYSKLMATYDSIFVPKPPLLPPYLPPAYTKCNCGDKNCTLINSPNVSSPKYTTPPAYKEKHLESKEFGLPNVDEHFRKSLGDKYELIKCEHINERPSSVDDHFAKALGQKWFTMECSKCKT